MAAYLSFTSKSWVRRVQKFALSILLILSTPVAGIAHSVYSDTELRVLFAKVGRIYNIDPELLAAMAEVESGGDSRSVSPRGALGLMQLMPATASAFSVLDPFNPAANEMGAAGFLDYLRHELANNGSLQGLPALLAAYNAGPRAVEKYKGIPPYLETHQYVRRVIQQYAEARSGQTTAAPVLILGPNPYVIKIRPGSRAMQPEPVLINIDGDSSVLTRLAALRRLHRYFVAAVGTGTAPWLKHGASQTLWNRAQGHGSAQSQSTDAAFSSK